MSRLRKVSRLWRNPDADRAASRVAIAQDETLFSIDPPKIFGRRAPLEIEIGAGRGDFIIEYAAAHPEWDFLALELSGTVARLLAVRCGHAELNNLRVLRADARSVVGLLLPERSVAAFHIYFPDPWPKERHKKHRLFSSSFVNGLKRTLERGGLVHAASDVKPWSDEMFAHLEAGGFARVDKPTPGSHATGFARKFIAQGKPIFAASFAILE
jgi:tRNA (guanine-N7-)-methyltransferase